MKQDQSDPGVRLKRRCHLNLYRCSSGCRQSCRGSAQSGRTCAAPYFGAERNARSHPGLVPFAEHLSRFVSTWRTTLSVAHLCPDRFRPVPRSRCLRVTAFVPCFNESATTLSPAATILVDAESTSSRFSRKPTITPLDHASPSIEHVKTKTLPREPVRGPIDLTCTPVRAAPFPTYSIKLVNQ